MGPSLAKTFLAHYEQIWVKDCPDEFKPVYYKRYVDDIFVLFRSPHHLEKFNEYLNTKHAYIKFTSEKEVNRSLPFLDMLIPQNKEDFTATVYHKPTFSGVYCNSFIADEYKHGLIFTLLFRIFSIVSDFSKFHEEVNYLKDEDVLKKNSFPTNLVDKCIKIFLNKQFSQKILEHTVPKKELFIVLLYLGMPSLLQKSINSDISFCKIKIIFKSSKQLANFFRFKDKTPLCLRSNIVYKFTCGRCNATYYGEKCHHFKVRVGEHSRILRLTNKRSK